MLWLFRFPNGAIAPFTLVTFKEYNYVKNKLQCCRHFRLGILKEIKVGKLFTRDGMTELIVMKDEEGETCFAILV